VVNHVRATAAKFPIVRQNGSVSGHRQLRDISRAEVAKLDHALKAKPGAANRCLSVLSKMFNLAERWGLRSEGSNPVRHIDKYREHKIERFLSAEELSRLGATLKRAETERILGKSEGGENPYAIAAIGLLLFTGARKSEILTARWEEVDFENGALVVPDSKTGAKTITLSAPALSLLEKLPRIEGNPYVLPGHIHGSHLVNISKFWGGHLQGCGHRLLQAT
jgi:integrase